MIYVYRGGRIVPKDNGYVGVTRGPYVISDAMEPTEQVDGKHYTSKAAFRAVGRSLGLVEVGNEKLPPKQRASVSRETREKRRESLKIAVEKYRAGYRL